MGERIGIGEENAGWRAPDGKPEGQRSETAEAAKPKEAELKARLDTWREAVNLINSRLNTAVGRDRNTGLPTEEFRGLNPKEAAELPLIQRALDTLASTGYSPDVALDGAPGYDREQVAARVDSGETTYVEEAERVAADATENSSVSAVAALLRDAYLSGEVSTPFPRTLYPILNTALESEIKRMSRTEAGVPLSSTAEKAVEELKSTRDILGAATKPDDKTGFIVSETLINLA